MYFFVYIRVAPSQSPTGVFVFNVTATAFQVSWSDPPPDTHNGVIRNYELVLTNQNTGAVSQTSTQRANQLFDNLRPATVYSYQLRAVTVSPGPFSTNAAITTLEDGVLFPLYIHDIYI